MRFILLGVAVKLSPLAARRLASFTVLIIATFQMWINFIEYWNIYRELMHVGRSGVHAYIAGTLTNRCTARLRGGARRSRDACGQPR